MSCKGSVGPLPTTVDAAGFYTEVVRSHLTGRVCGMDLDIEIVTVGACLARPLSIGGLAEPEAVTIWVHDAPLRMGIRQASFSGLPPIHE